MAKQNCRICGKPTNRTVEVPLFTVWGPTTSSDTISVPLCSEKCEKAHFERAIEAQNARLARTKTSCPTCKGTKKVKGYHCCTCNETGEI